jgi:hypothetical protein
LEESLKKTILAIFGLAVMALGQEKAIMDPHCKLMVPADWVDLKVTGVGAHAPGDMGFNASVRAMPGSSTPNELKTLKAKKGSVVDDNSVRVLLAESMTAGKKKYVVITKDMPWACRATVTFPADKDAAARKIADSAKLMK